MLSSRDITAMRRAVLQAQNDSAQVLRKMLAPDGAGGNTETWPVVHTYPVRVIALHATGEAAQAGRLVQQVLYRHSLPWNADVIAADRLLIGPLTYEVTGIEAGETEPIELIVQCQIVS